MIIRHLCSIGLLVYAGLGLCACASPETKMNSGLWHYNAGLYGQAIPLLLSGTPEIERDNPSDPRLPTAYIALGEMAVASKENKRAEDFYNKALTAARTYHPQDSQLNRNALVHTGNFLRNQGRASDALPLLVDAAAISSSYPATLRRLHAIDLDNLSLAYSGIQDHAKATVTNKRALDVLSGLEQSSEVKATTGVVLFNAAYGLTEQGRTSEADVLYRQSLTLVSTYGEQWRKNVVLFNYATFLRKAGRNAEAQALESQIKK